MTPAEEMPPAEDTRRCTGACMAARNWMSFHQKDIPFFSRKVLGALGGGACHTKLAKLGPKGKPFPNDYLPLLSNYSADRELGPLVMMTCAKAATPNRCCGSVLARTCASADELPGSNRIFPAHIQKKAARSRTRHWQITWQLPTPRISRLNHPTE